MASLRRSTLKDRLSGRVVHGTNPGPKPYLTRDEETELSAHLLQASSIGLGRTRRDVKSIVGSFVKSKGLLKGKTVSNGWWEKFLKRNPTLSLRSGDSTAGVRLNAMTAENMKAYNILICCKRCTMNLISTATRKPYIIWMKQEFR